MKIHFTTDQGLIGYLDIPALAAPAARCEADLARCLEAMRQHLKHDGPKFRCPCQLCQTRRGITGEQI